MLTSLKLKFVLKNVCSASSSPKFISPTSEHWSEPGLSPCTFSIQNLPRSTHPTPWLEILSVYTLITPTFMCVTQVFLLSCNLIHPMAYSTSLLGCQIDIKCNRAKTGFLIILKSPALFLSLPYLSKMAPSIQLLKSRT